MGYALCKYEIKEICVYFYGHPKRKTNHKYAHVCPDLGRVAMLYNNLDAPDGGIALSAAKRASVGKQKAFVSKSINAKSPVAGAWIFSLQWLNRFQSIRQWWQGHDCNRRKSPRRKILPTNPSVLLFAMPVGRFRAN